MKVLVTGANGQLGRCLQDRLVESLHQFYAPGKQELDISSESSLSKVIQEYQPDIIINAAAYTAVDKAEEEISQAFLVNETAVSYLAKFCSSYTIPLIHISTDYVFDGEASNPYPNDFPASPQSVYGKSKLAGENAIKSLLNRHIIIRTSWIFSEYGNNFVKTILRLATERDSLGVVADQFGCPTYAGDLASAIVKICEQVDSGKESWGTYHYCGSQETNWHQFAVAIINAANSEKNIAINPITTEQFPTLAKRPKYSVMDCNATLYTWDVNLSNWSQSLRHVVKLLS